MIQKSILCTFLTIGLIAWCSSLEGKSDRKQSLQKAGDIENAGTVWEISPPSDTCKEKAEFSPVSSTGAEDSVRNLAKIGLKEPLGSEVPSIAYWEIIGTKKILINAVANTQGDVEKEERAWLSTGTIITLSPGKWVVSGSLVLPLPVAEKEDRGTWVRCTFCDSVDAEAHSIDIEDNDKTAYEGLAWNSRHEVLVGATVINNNTESSKRYYLKTTGVVVEIFSEVSGSLKTQQFYTKPGIENIIRAERIED